MTEALINHLWQSTLCVGAAALLTLAFRKNSAKVRFYIWLAASLKFLIPFSLFVWAGSHLRWGDAPALPASSTASILMDQISQPAVFLASQIGPAPDVIAGPTLAWNGWMIVLGIWLLGAIVPHSGTARRDRRSRALPLASSGQSHCRHPHARGSALLVSPARVVARRANGCGAGTRVRRSRSPRG